MGAYSRWRREDRKRAEERAAIEQWEADGGTAPSDETATDEGTSAESDPETGATSDGAASKSTTGESTTASAEDGGENTGAATAAAVAFDFGLLDLSIKKALDEIKKISDRKPLEALRDAERKNRKRPGMLKALEAQLQKVAT